MIPMAAAGEEVSRPLGELAQAAISGLGPMRWFPWHRDQRHRPVLEFLVSTGGCTASRACRRPGYWSDGIGERDRFAGGVGICDLPARGLADVPAGVDDQNPVSQVDLAQVEGV